MRPAGLPGSSSGSSDFVAEHGAQRVVFGWGRLEDLPAEVERFAARRVLLVSSSSAKPLVEVISARLGARVAAAIASVRPHVPRADADDARAQAARSRSDLVVTIGGGSATGLGKAVVLEHHAPLLAIPTTYAGSEVTPLYGVTEDGRKRTGRDERVLPKTVLYDPALTTSLPAAATAATGLNALAHCVEALYAQDVSPGVEARAVDAIRTLSGALPGAVTDPHDRTARTDALYGAYLAGTVLAAAGMALHHRICHVLGGRFGLPHGDLNAAVLPHALAYNAPSAPAAVARVAAALGARDAALALFETARSLGAPTSLRALGLARGDLAGAAAEVVDSDFYNPRPVTLEDVVAILDAAWEGRPPAR